MPVLEVQRYFLACDGPIMRITIRRARYCLMTQPHSTMPTALFENSKMSVPTAIPT